MMPPPRRYLAIPESARSPLKWGPRQLALALPPLMARMIQGCRSSDMWERERVFFYTYWCVKRLTKQRGVVLVQVNPCHVSFRTTSNHISISLGGKNVYVVYRFNEKGSVVEVEDATFLNPFLLSFTKCEFFLWSQGIATVDGCI